MRRLRAFIVLVLLALASNHAAAQMRPIFDPDDFIDPRERSGPLFVSRLVLGAMRSAMDDYRPLRQDAGFLHLANSFYWSRFQADYKHSETRGENANPPAEVQICPCQPPVYFPSSSPPLPGAKDTLQFASYLPLPGEPDEPPVMLRYRLSFSREKIDAVVTYLDTGHHAATLRGHEQSIGIDADTYVRGLFGTVSFARMTRNGTTDDRARNELAYMFRPPGRAIGKVLVLATLTVGGVTGRGMSGINVINPAFEAFFHEPRTRANVRVVWSPIATRREGWTTHHQLLISVDRSLYLKLFSPHRD